MKRMNPPFMLPTPWFCAPVQMLLEAGNAVVYAGAAWPSADRAEYVPFWFPCDVTLLDVRTAFTAAAGNYDLGVYDSEFTLLEATGSTAVAASVQILTLATPRRIPAGEILYAALVVSDVGASCYRTTVTTLLQNSTGLNVCEEALGSTALPATATPAAASTTYVPLFSYGIN